MALDTQQKDWPAIYRQMAQEYVKDHKRHHGLDDMLNELDWKVRKVHPDFGIETKKGR